MKPKIAFFLASSLIATGMTLASNVSFGQRAGRFLADAFEFVGPVSGLFSSIVKSGGDRVARATLDFTPESLKAGFHNNSYVNSASYDQNAALIGSHAGTFSATSGFISSANSANPASGFAPRSQESRFEVVPGSNGIPATSTLVNPFLSSKTGSLLEAYAKSASSLTREREDIWNFMASRPGAFDLSRLVLGRTGERTDKEVLDLNGNALAKDGTTASTLNNQLLAPTLGDVTDPSGQVPLPSSLLLVLAGLGLTACGLCSKNNKR